LVDSRTLYVAYRAVASNDTGESNEAFFRRVFAMIDTARVDRFVLDVRENGGGNGYYNRYLVRGILERPAIDTAGKLFVIIGRRTFSAAQNLVNDLEQWSAAIFVGEPTGNAPNFFGDHEPLELPHSHLHVMVSTLWWQQQDPRDHRAWVPPQVATEMTAADYRNNVDPAMSTVLNYAGRATVARLLTEALANRDTAMLTRALLTFRSNPENRYAPVEIEVNRLGYELLRGGHADDAVRVFRLNVAEFPQSANAFDSLGAALEQMGQREEAVAAYRRAVELVPQFPPSRAALVRLGAARR
jgi:tetratricopeptide (TPR) repeat protein